MLRFANEVENAGEEWLNSDAIGADGWHYQLRKTMAAALEDIIHRNDRVYRPVRRSGNGELGVFPEQALWRGLARTGGRIDLGGAESTDEADRYGDNGSADP